LPTTREEIEKRMDELARKYTETHDKKIVEELYELARALEKLEKKRFTN
jgi:FKBP-type peptidyl-prolyl cis-trans isomerase (trigger factor)